MIGNAVDHLRVHDNGIESDKVRDEQTDFLTLIENIKHRLLPGWDLLQAKLDHQRIFVRLLNYSMTKRVQNLDRAANDLENFVSEQ